MTNTKTPTKKGGNFTKDLANLSVPFGLILAQKSLEKYLQLKPNKKETTKPKKVPANKPKKEEATTKAKKSSKSKTLRKTIS